MTASKLPVGLPSPNPIKSYWQTSPLPIANHRSTANLPSSSKYVIVGSGITGASIAYKLLLEEPVASITILEAREASSGATGRNGGHCRAGRYLSFKNYLEKFGEEDTLRMEKLEEDKVKNGSFIRIGEVLWPRKRQVAAIRPGSNIIDNPALKRTMGLNSAISGDYMQSRAEEFSGSGGIIIGGGRRLGTHGEQPILDDTTIHPNVSEYLRHAAAKYFGKENWGENGEVLQEWTGIIGYTADEQPVVGEAPGQEGLWICAEFHGHGMATTYQSAEAPVQLLKGNQNPVDEWLPKNYRLSRFTDRSCS